MLIINYITFFLGENVDKNGNLFILIFFVNHKLFVEIVDRIFPQFFNTYCKKQKILLKNSIKN